MVKKVFTLLIILALTYSSNAPSDVLADGFFGGGSSSSSTANAPVFAQTATVTVTATSETTLLGAGSGTLTLPANYFAAAGSSLIIESYGRITTTTVPGTQRIRLKFGSTVILDTGAYSLVGSITDGVWRLRTIITARTVGASGTVIAESIFESTGAALVANEAKMLNTTTITVDTTATQAVGLTNLFDTASNSISTEVFVVQGSGGSSTHSLTTGALSTNGANCSAGSYPLGVDASGAAESCTAVTGTYTIQGGCATASLSDATTYYSGSIAGLACSNTTAAIRRMYFPKACTITKAYLFFKSNTAPSNESSTISIRLNNTSDTTISATTDLSTDPQVISNTGLSIAIAAGDYVEIKWLTPTWASNPASLAMATTLECDY